jgi:hypothetical protein
MPNRIVKCLSMLTIGLFGILGLRYPSAASQDKAAVKCEIWISSTQPSESQTSLLHVLIQNTTAHEATIKGIEVRLTGNVSPQDSVVGGSQGAYWAWVDPETKSALRTSFDPKSGLTYPEKKRALPAEKELDFSLDLRRLQWESELSSALPPSAPLQAVVPHGTYEVTLNINGSWNARPLSIESNKVTMEIRKQSRKAQ